MPVCITGMHRSGTSMVAHALSLCGLDLGPEDQLLPADAWNSDGYWENRRLVELDDWILEQLGGGWDMPPAARADDELRTTFTAAARKAVSEVGFSEPWGWKDPRVSLLADLWRDAIPDIRFVVVVRNPIEVTLSLLRRGATSARLGLSLWSAYYSELLAQVPASDRVVVAHDLFLGDPSGSVERLVDRLGLAPDAAQKEKAVSSVDSGLRHHASDPAGLAALPAHIVDLYSALFSEARDVAPAEPPQGASTPELLRPASGDSSVSILFASYQERDRLLGEVEGLDSSVSILFASYQERDRLLGEVEGLTADRDNWREIANEHESERARLANAVEEAQRQAAALEADRDHWLQRVEVVEERLAAERAEVDELTRDRDKWAGELTRDRDRWAAQAEQLLGEHERLTHERNVLAAEIEALSRDRDTWRDEAGRLVTDRDAWQTEARHWRAETERLVEASQRRLRWRLRRAAVRFTRRLWWAMPAVLRDRLRPIIFRNAGGHPVVASEPRQEGEAPPPTRARPAKPRRAAPSRQAIGIPVSVVIPTFNAGSDAALFLAALERQVGVPELELVVADSGSKDGTRELFAAVADVMLDIPAGEFGHGRTRNQAVAASSGEVVVMTVQDAVLLGPHALHDLVHEVLSDDGLAAVSARQVPRSAADLYGAFNVVSHYRALWREGRRAGPADPLHRRAAAGVDDVCAALRRSAWEAIEYRDVEFGEDLDFGMRALEAGWRIGLSDAVAVAHSHTRDAPYQFRRSVADRLNIARLVGEHDVCRSATVADIGEIAAAGRAVLGDVAATLALGDDSPDRLSAQLRRIEERVMSPVTTKEPSGGQLGVLAEFLEGVADGAGEGAAGDPLRAELAALLRWPLLVEFADAQRGTPPDVVADFVAKLAAVVIGRSVGDRLRVEDSPIARERLLVGV